MWQYAPCELAEEIYHDLERERSARAFERAFDRWRHVALTTYCPPAVSFCPKRGIRLPERYARNPYASCRALFSLATENAALFSACAIELFEGRRGSRPCDFDHRVPWRAGDRAATEAMRAWIDAGLPTTRIRIGCGDDTRDPRAREQYYWHGNARREGFRREIERAFARVSANSERPVDLLFAMACLGAQVGPARLLRPFVDPGATSKWRNGVWRLMPAVDDAHEILRLLAPDGFRLRPWRLAYRMRLALDNDHVDVARYIADAYGTRVPNQVHRVCDDASLMFRMARERPRPSCEETVQRLGTNSNERTRMTAIAAFAVRNRRAFDTAVALMQRRCPARAAAARLRTDADRAWEQWPGRVETPLWVCGGDPRQLTTLETYRRRVFDALRGDWRGGWRNDVFEAVFDADDRNADHLRRRAYPGTAQDVERIRANERYRIRRTFA